MGDFTANELRVVRNTALDLHKELVEAVWRMDDERPAQLDNARSLLAKLQTQLASLENADGVENGGE